MSAAAQLQPHEVLTSGIYSYHLAGRILQVKPALLRRWLKGEVRTSTSSAEPLWTSRFAGAGLDAIGFLDLLELNMVARFRSHGVSLQLIRKALTVAREEMKAPYPFAMSKFFTDGERIFVRLEAEQGEERFLDLAKRQEVFARVVSKEFRASLDFESGVAMSWRPVDRVYLRPRINFGRPTVRAGVPTSILAAAFRAELGNVNTVAGEYEVDVEDVIAAVEFEQRLAA